jgi:hypothetical protein
MLFEGGCHCGAVRIAFETERPLSARVCECTYCTKQAARYVCDPSGQADVHSTVRLTRYRFGHEVSDFLTCPGCGSFSGAVTESHAGLRSALNLNLFDDPMPTLSALSHNFDGEPESERTARRNANWTPTLLDEPEPTPAPGA